MRIKRKFLQLTSWTYPYGTEHTAESYLPDGYKKDENDNYYYVIGDNPTTMFACHIDTSCSDQVRVNHVFDGNIIRTDKKSILGADDKAGMTVVLYMIERKIPGLYYFFVGEEVGCVGSSAASKKWNFPNIKKCISFDRRGTTSVITHQLYGRCCSDEFAKELSSQLNGAGYSLHLEPDDTGIMTDSAQFTEIIPECTNISVGYYKEHTVDEHQDIDFLSKLCLSVVKIDWENLPVKRDPSIQDDDNWGWGKFMTGDYSTKYDYGQCGVDEEEDRYEFVDSYYTFIKWGKVTKRMYVSKTHIEKEKSLIYKWIFANGMYFGMTGITWNGNSLYVESERGRMEFVGTRTDLMEMIPELSSVPKKDLSDKVGPKQVLISESPKNRMIL